MSMMAMAAPILPGKKEQWDRFIGELTGGKSVEFNASRQRAGVRERTFLQELPDGTYLVIVTLEGDDPEGALGRIANQDTDFMRWFVQQVQEIHGFDLRQPLPGSAPRLVVDSGANERTGDLAEWAQIISMRVKPGKEQEMIELLRQIHAFDGPGSGLLRSTAGRDQKNPRSMHAIVLFASEGKARDRERDPKRQQMLQPIQAKMKDLLETPMAFTDLDVVDDYQVPSADSVQIAERVIEELINNGNLAVFDELIASDFVEHELPPGVPQGREGTKQLFADLHKAFPDLHVNTENVVANGDMVVLTMTWTGTQTGAFMGIPPTGKRASWQVIDMLRVTDGKVAEHWGLMDQLGLLQQLGIIPAAQPAMT